MSNINTTIIIKHLYNTRVPRSSLYNHCSCLLINSDKAELSTFLNALGSLRVIILERARGGLFGSKINLKIAQ